MCSSWSSPETFSPRLRLPHLEKGRQILRLDPEGGPFASEEAVVADQMDGELEAFQVTAGLAVRDRELVGRGPAPGAGGTAHPLLRRPGTGDQTSAAPQLDRVRSAPERTEPVGLRGAGQQLGETLAERLGGNAQPDQPPGVLLQGESERFAVQEQGFHRPAPGTHPALDLLQIHHGSSLTFRCGGSAAPRGNASSLPGGRTPCPPHEQHERICAPPRRNEPRRRTSRPAPGPSGAPEDPARSS
jgi:hypothetical protein